METNSPEGQTTIAGWSSPISPAALLRFLHPIPRPFSYWAQLRADARNYKPWLYWIVGGGLIAFGVAWLSTHYPGRDTWWAAPWLAFGSIVVGGKILLSWARAIYNVVQWDRYQPLNVGVIKTVYPHPVWRDLVFADAVQADGTVVKVVIEMRAFVERFLQTYGECDVLILRRPWTWEMADSGCVVAVRAVPTGGGTPAAGPVDHWTALNRDQRLELEQIARAVDYTVDAVSFVLSARSAAAARQHNAGSVGPGDGHHITARELCEFIPEHAAWMFGSPTRASDMLSALGLRTGDDVGAIVAGCAAAGWWKRGSGDSADDFRGIALRLTPSRTAGWWKRRPPRRSSSERSPPTTTAGKIRRVLFAFFRGFFLGACVGAVVLAAFIVWAERLTPEERPLVGRWSAPSEENHDELKLLAFGTDRSCRLQVLRRGGIAARGSPGRWAVREGRIIIAPPVRSFPDRIARLLGRVPKEAEFEISFRTPDPDTLDTERQGRRIVFRRVAAGIPSDVDLFPPRPADDGRQRP